MLFQGVGPAVEDDFPSALLEGHGVAQGQHVGLGHDVFAFLILLDGVGVLRGFL